MLSLKRMLPLAVGVNSVLGLYVSVFVTNGSAED